MPGAIARYIVDQRRQAKRILEALDVAGADAAVLACDCNAQLTATTYPLLLDALSDPVRELGARWFAVAPEGTSSQRSPMRIDHVLYDGVLEPLGTWRMHDTGGSDHAPAFVDFRRRDAR